MTQSRFVKKITALLLILFPLESVAFSASFNESLSKAKREAEAQGYIFANSREDIVAGAKREGKLRVLSALDAFRELRKAFAQLHPYIDLQVEEIKGSDEPQKFLLELKAGGATSNWDVFDVAPELYQDFLPYVKKFDFVSMARHGVLQIPIRITDPKNKNIVSIASTVHVIAYNKRLLPPDHIPSTWEDFLKPEFKGKKFMVDIRPQGFAALAAGLGEEWTMSYARKIKQQDPIGSRPDPHDHFDL